MALIMEDVMTRRLREWTTGLLPFTTASFSMASIMPRFRSDGIDYGAVTYQLYDQAGTLTTHQGALEGVDNGYHRRARFLWPDKHAGNEWVPW